jgi:hypothetical protein
VPITLIRIEPGPAGGVIVQELASSQVSRAKEMPLARRPNVRVLLIFVLIADWWHILARTDRFFLLCYSSDMKILRKIVLISCLTGVSTAGAGEDDEDGLIKTEMEFHQTIELEYEYASNACQAAIEIEYYQKGASAHVESALTNDDCGASSGSYVIQIRYRDADRQSQSKEFPETWERADSNPVVVEKDYFVADDIDILRVRSRKLDCTCAPEESAEGD